MECLARSRYALPSASFIGFTGTPIEKTDANTRAVFGDYITLSSSLSKYPPDLQEEAVKTVLAQAELLCAEWV